MTELQREIQNMLDVMKAKALGDVMKERETTEIAALVLQQSLPDDGQIPRSIIPTYAQAVLMRGHLRYLAWKSSGILDPVN